MSSGKIRIEQRRAGYDVKTGELFVYECYGVAASLKTTEGWEPVLGDEISDEIGQMSGFAIIGLNERDIMGIKVGIISALEKLVEIL